MTARNEALAQAMAARGMTAGQVGSTLGVARTTVTHWRCGHRTPSRFNAARVAALLGVPVEQLWPALAEPDLLAERRERIDRVAAAAGVTRKTVRSWFAGRHQPGPLARAALAANGFTTTGRHASEPSRRNAGSHIRPFTVREVLALPAQHEPRWRKRARCASSPDPDLWWPEDDHDPGAAARQVCARCPVIAACRDDFLANPLPDTRCVIAGVWGQTLLAEAQRQRREQRAA